MGLEIYHFRRGIWEYLASARKEAQKSIVRFQHGAVIVVRGTIVARGFNKRVLACQTEGAVSIHAEVDAVSRCPPKLLKDAVLYVVRINGTGKFCDSGPCEHCKSYIERMGIRTVFYS